MCSVTMSRCFCYLRGIIPDYLSLRRQSMSDYEILYLGDCEPFFNQSKAFACATDFHHGNSAAVFYRYHQYWQMVKALA